MALLLLDLIAVAGGEIKNSIMMGFSNKGHDGYMGDSVIGEWCNWGAGTSNSNLKNTGGNVGFGITTEKAYKDAGIKCGVIMGDYTRTSINTSINTGLIWCLLQCFWRWIDSQIFTKF